MGQGTGFEYMTPPWFQYEAYGMKMTNNLIYESWGAGLGVIGSYSTLVAHNTMYRCDGMAVLPSQAVGV